MEKKPHQYAWSKEEEEEENYTNMTSSRNRDNWINEIEKIGG